MNAMHLRDDSGDATDSWFTLAERLAEFGCYAKAVAAYRRAQAVDRHRPALGMARAAWHRGDARGAEERYQAILRSDDMHVGALCGLAGMYLSAGQLSEAWRLLARALSRCPHFPAALRLLGQTHLQAGRLPQAQTAIRRSLDVEPRNEHSWLAMATVCGRLMQPEAALAAYRAAERINPKRRLAHLSIGHVLKTLGKRAECERVYHECLQQDPTSGEAYWSLADLKNYVFTDAEIAAMEALVAGGAGDEINLAALYFSLGRAYEQRHEYTRAFAHYATGNRLRRAQTPFDYAAFEAKCERVGTLLGADFFAAHRGGGVADESPIFIVGLPRSGSTLVEQILASHSKVEGTMELPNILHYVQEFEQLARSGDAYPESLAQAPRAVLKALGRRYLDETRPLRRGRARFIDKLPNNFMHIGLIHAMLPKATIIDVRRHPMDSGFSCFKQNFAAGQTFTYDLEGLGRYYRQYLKLMDHWDAVLPAKVLHVSYEELVHAPEPVIRRVLAHCGLGFEAQCLSFHETQRPVRTASSEQVRRPMSTAAVGHWRKFEHELEPLRVGLGDCLARFPSSGLDVPARMRRTALGRPRPVCKPRVVLSCAIGAVLYAGLASRASTVAATDDSLAEVVVTARRRSENVQDVPQNIDVYTAQKLTDLSIVKLEDVVALSPSISMISTGPGGQRITIRGASDGSSPNYGSGNLSVVGYLVDDLALDYFGHNPDLHLYDVERIEVLNGPQGTLFGPSALTGAVRIVTKKPDTHTFSAGGDVDGGVIAGGGNNGTYEGFANIPLVDGVSAVRLSGFSVHEGGYIDNLPSSRTWSVDGVTSNNAPWAGDNFNTRSSFGGRVALLQNIGENWHVLLSGNYQEQKYRGSWEDDPTLAGERQLRYFGPSGGYNYARFLEVHVDGDVGIADLVYTAGMSRMALMRLYDFSEYSQYSNYAPLIQPLTCVTDPTSGPGDHGCKAPYMYGRPGGTINRFTNEIRLQSKPGGRAHWTLGVYSDKLRNVTFGDEHLPNINFNGGPAQALLAEYSYTGKPVLDDYYSSYYIDNYNEATEFGDVTFDLDDLWSIEAGVQHFHSAVDETQAYATYFYYQRYSSYHRESSNKTNLKAGINFKPRLNSLLYFSFAQGYREGGFNYIPQDKRASLPTTFDPDTLDNYELGFKTEELGGRLIWNNAAYLMLWKDYQTKVDVVGPPYGFNANIGNARIAGIESTLEVVPVDGLHLSLNGNYNDARLRSNEYHDPNFVVLAGERLSEAPLFNGSAVARYERRIAGTSAFAQVDVIHKGSMWNGLQVDQRILQPQYSLLDLRVGLSDGAGAWRAEGYVTNIANKRAVVYEDTTGYAYYPGISTPQLATPPRVVGVRLSYNWKPKP